MLLLLTAIIFIWQLEKFPAQILHAEPVIKSIAAGIRFVLHQPMIKYAMCLDLCGVLFGGVTALLPVYALDLLHTGAAGLGIMRMAQSIGAALTMLALIRLSPMGKPWRNLLIAVTGFGMAVIGFGVSHIFLLSLLFLFLQGAFDSVSVMIRGTLLQILTPDEMRGRVSALNGMFIGSSIELGNFESGLAAKFLGTIPAVIFGGSMTLIIVILTFLKTRALLTFSENK
jgi:MFS family permease